MTLEAGPALGTVLNEIRACQICASALAHAPRPVLSMSATARLCVAGQAPGLRVHETGIPFNDRSGERLRAWMGVSREEFYDEARIAIVPMGFCFPGYDGAGADKPPRRECAKHWHDKLFEAAPDFPLILVVGAYATKYHLGDRAKRTLTETVYSWRDYRPRFIPLPHPSWRNTLWLRKNPWFEEELLPCLKRRVRRALSGAS